MKEHELKTDPVVFEDVISGKKKHEIRFDDRGFEVGDLLKLRKTRHTGEEMKAGKPLEYIESPAYFYVTHIQRGYGLKDGWVILSVEPRDACSCEASMPEINASIEAKLDAGYDCPHSTRPPNPPTPPGWLPRGPWDKPDPARQCG